MVLTEHFSGLEFYSVRIDIEYIFKSGGGCAQLHTLCLIEEKEGIEIVEGLFQEQSGFPRILRLYIC